jgi:2-haloacid dehalogenase
LDIHSPAAALSAGLGKRAEDISAQWRTKQVEYAWLRSLMGRYADFSKVTADALDYVLAANGIANEQLRERLLAHYNTLAAYPDAAGCLQKLKNTGLRTGILSNGSPSMLAAAVSSAGLGALLDYVLSVDTVQIYKPSPQVYQLAVNAFGLEPESIAFVSGNGWDCAGAASFGFQVVHVNRSGQPEERLGSQPRAHVADLTEASSQVLKMAG